MEREEQIWLWRPWCPLCRSSRWALHTQRGEPEVYIWAFFISQTQPWPRRVGGCRAHSKFSECPTGRFQSPKSSDQTLLSFVIISTLTIWSNELQMQRPLLSGLQSILEMGWVDNVTFCKRLTEPATPISTPSESFFDRWAGYSLKARTKKRYSTCKGKSCNYHLQNPSKHSQNGWQTLDPPILRAPC